MILEKMGFDTITISKKTLPVFFSPTVANVLVENFDIKPIGSDEEDIEAMMAGK